MSHKPSDAFIRLWLATDTHIYNMTPAQFKKVRELCDQFYEAGRRAATKADETAGRQATA